MKRIAALLLFVFAAQAHASLFSDDEARQQIFDLRAQVQGQLQKQDERLLPLEAANKRMLELLSQIDKLNEQIANLRGKIEVLQFNQDEAIKRQKDLYVDLDTRLRTMEQAKEQAKLDQKNAQQAAEKKQLDDAIALVKGAKHKDGIAALSKFISDNPQSTKQAEATYWMGAGYAALKDYKSAKNAFNTVVSKMPDDPRAPDALLGLASIAAAQKDTKTSRKYLLGIVEKYPQSEAAATASRALTTAN
ncbi:MAG: tol-pal system protein YbgF [Formivibrio sp.]|nr:tol-pal system protein YbgF [Formivibrio sp.]